MKALKLIIFYIGVFAGVYFLLSLFGCIIGGYTYLEAISNSMWFEAYTFLIGWWVAAIPTMDLSKEMKLDWF